jgi:hypothetical protein
MPRPSQNAPSARSMPAGLSTVRPNWSLPPLCGPPALGGWRRPGTPAPRLTGRLRRPGTLAPPGSLRPRAWRRRAQPLRWRSTKMSVPVLAAGHGGADARGPVDEAFVASRTAGTSMTAPPADHAEPQSRGRAPGPGCDRRARRSVPVPGPGGQTTTRHPFPALLDGNWLINDVVRADARVFGPRGKDRKLTSTRSYGSTRRRRPNTPTSMIAMDSTDGTVNATYRLAWKRRT